MNSNPTISELRLAVQGTAKEASLDYIFAQNHDSRVKAVQKCVDYACNLLEQHKHKKQGLDEDAITLQICEMLKMAGFDATHDEDIGGHCDVVVKGDDLFLWLAEAKKHSSYEWLDKGFQQLSTRYSTGVKGQDNGDILIYCYVEDAKKMLDKWREELKKRNKQVKVKDSPCGNPLIFLSSHKHSSTGLDFNIRHKVIALHWKPKDK